VITSALRYSAPTSTIDACQLLAAAGPGGAVAGGGTIIVPALVRRERQVTELVYLHRAGLGHTVDEGSNLLIGATATYNDILASTLVATQVPMLTTLADGITGGVQLRNQGTLAGSACYANPSSDAPAALVALGAQVRICEPQGAREVAAEDFFVAAYRTVLGPAELVTGLAVPTGPSRSGYVKLKLSEGSWPIATAAAVSRPGADGWRCRLVLGGVRATPLEVGVDDLVDAEGTVPEQALAEVVRRVDTALDEPWADELAPPGYRRQVAGPVAARALRRLAACRIPPSSRSPHGTP
jgi:carbon-monoxide dehydrogenase medium subunit